ncbi:MAG: hypothetical protein LKI17_00150 [Megasphaera cerevisiae]|nr:hypothetical protein [Megasphaera cerevisiae]
MVWGGRNELRPYETGEPADTSACNVGVRFIESAVLNPIFFVSGTTSCGIWGGRNELRPYETGEPADTSACNVGVRFIESTVLNPIFFLLGMTSLWYMGRA